MATRTQLTGISLCSGIGGLDLGVNAVFGSRTVCYVEREAYAAALLVARMEDQALDPAPIWDDLKTFDGKPWRGRVDILHAGYPCQPFSQAGNREGKADPRHLWPDVARIIGEVAPRVVVLENVRGHVSLGLREVLEDLHGLGFDAEWGVYRASDAGAPHRRERVFILAYRRGERCGWGTEQHMRAGSECQEGEQGQHANRHDMEGGTLADTTRELYDGRGTARSDGRGKPSDSDEQLADTDSESSRVEKYHSGGQERQSTGTLEPEILRRIDGENCTEGVGAGSQQVADTDSEGSQERQGERRDSQQELAASERGSWPPGPEDDWSEVPPELWPATQPPVRGVADAGFVANRVDRLRALGNAVCPQQAELALRDLMGRAEFS